MICLHTVKGFKVLFNILDSIYSFLKQIIFTEQYGSNNPSWMCYRIRGKWKNKNPTNRLMNLIFYFSEKFAEKQML